MGGCGYLARGLSQLEAPPPALGCQQEQRGATPTVHGDGRGVGVELGGDTHTIPASSSCLPPSPRCQTPPNHHHAPEPPSQDQLLLQPRCHGAQRVPAPQNLPRGARQPQPHRGEAPWSPCAKRRALQRPSRHPNCSARTSWGPSGRGDQRWGSAVAHGAGGQVASASHQPHR